MSRGLGDVYKRQVQEALTNVARHAAATAVEVRVAADTAAVHGEVTDDGRGFEPGPVASSLGLAGMRERAALAGGRLEVASAPGAGTRVAFEVPLA